MFYTAYHKSSQFLSMQKNIELTSKDNRYIVHYQTQTPKDINNLSKERTQDIIYSRPDRNT